MPLGPHRSRSEQARDGAHTTGTVLRTIFRRTAPTFVSSRCCSARPACKARHATPRLPPKRPPRPRVRLTGCYWRSFHPADRVSRVRLWRWRTYSAATAKRFDRRMPVNSARVERRVMGPITACRTVELGGHSEQLADLCRAGTSAAASLRRWRQSEPLTALAFFTMSQGAFPSLRCTSRCPFRTELLANVASRHAWNATCAGSSSFHCGLGQSGQVILCSRLTIVFNLVANPHVRASSICALFMRGRSRSSFTACAEMVSFV